MWEQGNNKNYKKGGSVKIKNCIRGFLKKLYTG